MPLGIAACPPERHPELDAALAGAFPSLGAIPASRRFPRGFAPETGVVLVAIDERNRIRGSTVARLFSWLDGGPPAAMLGLVWVDPALRGHGLGGALVRDAEQAAAARGARLSVLWASRHGLYERLGWRLADTGVVAEARGTGGGPRPPAPDAATAARISALRRAGVRRAAADHAAIPPPGTSLEAHMDPDGRAYALVGATPDRGYVVDWDGEPEGYPAVWRSITAAHARLTVNAEAGSPPAGWLAARAGLRWAPQRLALWRGLDGHGARHVAWADRI
jgi:predicted N-acetyltransferase YhbS